MSSSSRTSRRRICGLDSLYSLLTRGSSNLVKNITKKGGSKRRNLGSLP